MGVEQLILREYLEGNHDEINGLIKAIKENPVIRYKSREIKPKHPDLWMTPWGELLELKETIKEDMFSAINITHGLKLGALLEVPVLNVFACLEWISKQLLNMHEVEKQELHREPNAKEINAGINEFEPFGYANQLRRLRGNDLTKDEELLKLPYAIIFRELCMNRVEADFNESYSKQ